MKTFVMLRANRSSLVVELSLMDMIKLLFGREFMIELHSENIVLRHLKFAKDGK